MKEPNGARKYMADVEIGSMIKDKLKEQRLTVVWFASQLECSRTNVYKIFGKHSIDTAELLRISEILKFDFFKYYSDKLDFNK